MYYKKAERERKRETKRESRAAISIQISGKILVTLVRGCMN